MDYRFGKLITQKAFGALKILSKKPCYKSNTVGLRIIDLEKSIFDPKLGIKKIQTAKFYTTNGEIAKKQKPGTIKAKSVPTQQYIDEMLNVAKTERATEIAKNGHGWLNERAVADAKYAFTEGTKVEPVITTKVNLKDWIKAKFDFKTADELTRAEVKGTGKLPDRIAQAREDAYYAFTGEELTPTFGKKFKHLFMRAIGKEKPYDSMYLTDGRPAKWVSNKGLGLEL